MKDIFWKTWKALYTQNQIVIRWKTLYTQTKVLCHRSTMKDTFYLHQRFQVVLEIRVNWHLPKWWKNTVYICMLHCWLPGKLWSLAWDHGFRDVMQVDVDRKQSLLKYLLKCVNLEGQQWLVWISSPWTDEYNFAS